MMKQTTFPLLLLAAVGHATTFSYRLLALDIAAGFSLGGAYLLYKLTDLMNPLRVAPERNREGFDVGKHGEIARRVRGRTAYPARSRRAKAAHRLRQFQ